MGAKPKIQVSFQERDFGFKKLMTRADELAKKPYVKAGFTGERGASMKQGGKKTVAYIAKVHEYGATVKLKNGKSITIPCRSFMRSTKYQNQEKYNKHMAILGEQLLDADAEIDVRTALGLIGQEYISDVKSTIKNQIPPPLKQATIARKNKRKVQKAKAAVSAIHGKLAAGAARETAKFGVAREQRLSDRDKNRLNTAAQTIMADGGSSTPLIDKGQLINSLTYKVEMEGEKNPTREEETV